MEVLLVVGDKETIDKVIENILVGDLIEHEIDYIYLVDSDVKKVRDIKVIKKYKNLDIDEVFIATNMLTGDFEPIFYTQQRVGKNGRTISICKFRSMVYDAEEKLDEMLKDESYLEEWNKNQKFEDDPRITKVGKFIRKTSIDEMPQFINLVTGEMSLVGPRPF